MELRLMFDEDVPFKFTAEVIPLEQHRCRSRRDFAAFWETCNVWDPQFGVDLSNTPTLPLLLLPRPTEDIEGECFSAITHFGSRGNLAFVAELSLHSICRSMTDLGRVVVSKPGRRPSSRYPPFIDLKEGVQKPRETIWYPILQINHCEPGALEVFSLANKLTEEEKHWLRDEIVSTSLSYLEDAYLARSNPEGERFYVIAARNIDFLFKPWDEVNEIRGTGTIMDIWNVVFKSAMTDYPPPEAQIWIDPQSALDSTVIMVKPDYYGGPVEHELLNDIQCPRLRGFSYLRLPAKMIRCCFMTERRPSLDWGPLKDMKLELKAFRRPGWPAEGLLVDDP
ncbi:hypothetical protein N7470_006080 [Penicillium chermesinum]|nr:hypothetical protein N7470_006080 [Penicillium chermesinum]